MSQSCWQRGLEELTDRIQSQAVSEELPIPILAVLEDDVIAVAVLKTHEMVDRFPDWKYWLGSLYVVPEHRGKGLGTGLIAHVEELARRRDIDRLHLQTEHLDGGLYVRLGWKPRKRLYYMEREVLVMTRQL